MAPTAGLAQPAIADVRVWSYVGLRRSCELSYAPVSRSGVYNAYVRRMRCEIYLATQVYDASLAHAYHNLRIRLSCALEAVLTKLALGESGIAVHKAAYATGADAEAPTSLRQWQRSRVSSGPGPPGRAAARALPGCARLLGQTATCDLRAPAPAARERPGAPPAGFHARPLPLSLSATGSG